MSRHRTRKILAATDAELASKILLRLEDGGTLDTLMMRKTIEQLARRAAGLGPRTRCNTTKTKEMG